MAKTITLKTGTRKTSIRRQKITLAVEIVTSHRQVDAVVRAVKKSASTKSGKQGGSVPLKPKKKTLAIKSTAAGKKTTVKATPKKVSQTTKSSVKKADIKRPVKTTKST